MNVNLHYSLEDTGLFKKQLSDTQLITLFIFYLGILLLLGQTRAAYSINNNDKTKLVS